MSIACMNVIIINGPGGHGKDTIVEALGEARADICVENNISTIDPVREFLINLGVVNKDEPGVRQFMADVKRAWVKYDPFGPTTYAIDSVCDSIDCDNHKVVFFHIREPEEIYKMMGILKDREVPHFSVHVVSPGTSIPNTDVDNGTHFGRYNLELTNNMNEESLSECVRLINEQMKTHFNF